MRNDNLIPADQFCHQHNIELSFISLLSENGLIEITTVEQTPFIPEEHLPELEKLIRLHYDLDINIAGIEAITHLLKRMQHLQDELRFLRNRLRLFDENNET